METRITSPQSSQVSRTCWSSFSPPVRIKTWCTNAEPRTMQRSRKADIRNYFRLGLPLTNRTICPGFDCVAQLVSDICPSLVPGIRPELIHQLRATALRRCSPLLMPRPTGVFLVASPCFCFRVRTVRFSQKFSRLFLASFGK